MTTASIEKINITTLRAGFAPQPKDGWTMAQWLGIYWSQ